MLRTGIPATALLALAVGGALAAPAAAHAILLGSDPRDGATVTEPLTEVVLEFNEPVSDVQVQVADPAGASVVDGAPALQGDTVVQPVEAPVVHGEYSVAFRAVSADDHPVEGELTFAYEGPLAGEDTGGAPTPTPAAAPDATHVPEPTAEPPDETVEEDLAAGTAAMGGPPVGLIALGLLVAAALAAVWAFRRRLAAGEG